MDTIDFPFQCIECGADLRGATVTGACEQCKSPIGRMLKRVGVDVASGSVGDDLPCVRCGYNLRTLAVSDRCPECHADVHSSLRSDALRCADVSWLRCVRLGVRMLAGAIMAGAILTAFFTVAQGSLRGSERDVELFSYLAILVFTVIQLGAALAITQPEPHSRAVGRGDTVRRVARVFSVLLFAIWVVQYWGFLRAIVKPGFARAVDAWAASVASSSSPVWDTIEPVVSTCIGAFAWVAMFLWLRYLAQRAGRQALARWLTALLVFIIVQRGVHTVSLVRDALASTQRTSGSFFVNALGAVYMLLAFGVLVMSAGMLTEAIGTRGQNACDDGSEDDSGGSTVAGSNGVSA